MSQMLNYLIILYFNLVSSDSPLSSTIKPNFIYNRFKYDTIITVIVNSTTEQILDFYENSERLHGYPTRVHVMSNDTLNGEYPIFITALQQKGVLSWELPLEVQTSDQILQFRDMARTLCPHDAGPNITSVNRPTIQISTSHPHNLSVDIKLRRVVDFYVQTDKEISLTATPSTPKYYYFSFDSDPPNETYYAKQTTLLPVSRFNYSIPKSVLLTIDSNDTFCAEISIQNNSCPVFDNEREILYRGYRFSMTTKGGITLTQAMYPQGFYIVFLVRQSDEKCTGVSERDLPSLLTRKKGFRFKVEATISLTQYLIGASVLLALTFIFAAVAVSLAHCSCLSTEQVVLVEEVPSSSSQFEPELSETQPIINEEECESGRQTVTITRVVAPMTVASLRSPHATKQPRYFGSSLIVALVYALPVVQLLVTYQRMVAETGDQDVCYYNFLCAHPLNQMSDFNHVYSNIGYVVLGVIFMLQVRVRDNQEKFRDKNRGLALNASLLYSMGVTLTMEGVLSACYHLCPNKMNFQFDSSFMYALCVLNIVRLYSARHVGATPRAHKAFLLLAALMALGVYGIMYPSIYFWVSFTLLHLATCFILTLKIYYVGKIKLDTQMLTSAFYSLREHRHTAFIPDYRARAVLLAIANVLNWILAGYGLYNRGGDVARHILGVMLANSALHLAFYLTMKLVHRERIAYYTWLYLILSLVAWATAVSFFIDSKTKWSLTPSGSRSHNAPCSALQLYDSHDLWHGVSGAALYLTLNLLLTVDDPLRDTAVDKIPVF